MKTNTFYKVTCHKKSWLYLMGTGLGDYILSFKVGKKTVPKIGGIFVFDNPVSVVDFLRSKFSKDVSVFVGKGTNPVAIKVMSGYITREHIASFWAVRKSKKKLSNGIHQLYPVEKGVVIVDSFTPKKEYSFFEFVNEFGEI